MKYYSIEKLENEYLYLFEPSDSPIFKDMILEQKSYNLLKERCRTDFSSAIVEYDIFISFIAEFIRSLGIEKNAIVYSYVVSKLIREGYLSSNGVFEYTASRVYLDLVSFEWTDIIAKGIGCCRHVSELYNCLSNILGLKSQIVPFFS